MNEVVIFIHVGVTLLLLGYTSYLRAVRATLQSRLIYTKDAQQRTILALHQVAKEANRIAGQEVVRVGDYLGTMTDGKKPS
jgi:hypothetical protein